MMPFAPSPSPLDTGADDAGGTAALFDRAANSPVVLWVTIAVLVLIILARTLPQFFGPIAKMWADMADQRRRIATEKDDADMADLQKKVRYLVATVDDMRARQIEHDQVLTVHRTWDNRVQENPSHAREVPPPPLYPINGGLASGE